MFRKALIVDCYAPTTRSEPCSVSYAGDFKGVSCLKICLVPHVADKKEKRKKNGGGGREQKIKEEKEYFRPLQNAPVDFMLKLESDFRKRRTAGSNAKTPRSVTA